MNKGDGRYPKMMTAPETPVVGVGTCRYAGTRHQHASGTWPWYVMKDRRQTSGPSLGAESRTGRGRWHRAERAGRPTARVAVPQPETRAG